MNCCAVCGQWEDCQPKFTTFVLLRTYHFGSPSLMITTMNHQSLFYYGMDWASFPQATFKNSILGMVCEGRISLLKGRFGGFVSLESWLLLPIRCPSNGWLLRHASESVEPPCAPSSRVADYTFMIFIPILTLILYTFLTFLSLLKIPETAQAPQVEVSSAQAPVGMPSLEEILQEIHLQLATHCDARDMANMANTM